MRHQNRLTNIVLMGIAIVLSGCVTDLLPEPAPAPKVYRLTSSAVQVDPIKQAYLLRVDRPAVSKSLQGQNIIVSTSGQRLAVIEEAKWAEPLPAMIQTSLLDAIGSRKNIVGVLPTSGAKTDYRIHLTIRHFEADFDRGDEQAPLTIVDYTATLSNAKSRKLLGSKNFKTTQRATDFNVAQIVDAQEEANSRVMIEVTDWIINVLNNSSS